MSLINKMLKDLEARQSGDRRPDPQSIYQGLRSSSVPPAGRRRPLAVAVVAVLVLAAAGGWFVWQRNARTVSDVTAIPPGNVATPTGPATLTATNPGATTQPRKPSVATKVPVRPARSDAVPAQQAAAAIDITGRPLTQEEQAENKYREAVQMIRQGRTEDAEQRLRAALAIHVLHVPARETLVALLVGQGRWLEAQALLEEGLRRLPDQTTFAFLLARLHVEQGNDAAGLQLLERLEAKTGGDPDYIAFMATLYQRTGRHAEAVKYFKQATTARPTEGRWWAGLGISLEAENDREAARAAYQRAGALALDPRLAQYVADRLKQLPSR